MLGKGAHGEVFPANEHEVFKVIYVTSAEHKARAGFEAALYELFGQHEIGPKFVGYYHSHIHGKECRIIHMKRKLDFEGALYQGLICSETMMSICLQFEEQIRRVLQLGYFFVDVKPENVLFQKDDRTGVRVFLTDFDMCCAFAHQSCQVRGCIDMPFSMSPGEVATSALLSCLQLAISFRLTNWRRGAGALKRAFTQQLRKLASKDESEIQTLIAKLQGSEGQQFSLSGLLTWYYWDLVPCENEGGLARVSCLAFEKGDDVYCEKRPDQTGFLLSSARYPLMKFYSRVNALHAFAHKTEKVLLGTVVTACENGKQALRTVMQVKSTHTQIELENPIHFSRLATLLVQKTEPV